MSTVVELPYTILLSDTDASGLIHYAAVFRHVERAEMELYAGLGFAWPTLTKRLWLPRVHVEADYLRPLHLGAQGQIQIGVRRLGHSSITLEAHFLADGAVHVVARVIAVATAASNLRPIEIPADLRAALTRCLWQEERLGPAR